MRIGIGVSRHPDPGVAASEAVQQARQAVPTPQLAVVYGSIHLDQAKVYESLRSLLDTQILMGGSSYAEVTNAGVFQGSVAVLLLSFEDGSVRMATAPEDIEPYSMGESLAQQLAQEDPPSPREGGAAEDVRLGLLSVGMFTNFEDRIVQALADNLNRVPIFGGRTSGDYDLGFSHPEFWTNYQYTGDLAKTGGRMALLRLPRKDFKLSFAFEHGWQPIGPLHEFTRCEGHKIYEIDGQPILEFYRQFVGADQSDEFFEKMVQRYGFAEQLDGPGDASLFKIPIGWDFKDGYVSVSPASDMQGRKAHLIQATRRSTVQGARKAAQRCLEALEGAPPTLLLMISCCTRAAIMHSQKELELEAVREVFGEVPIFGYYSGGEFAPNRSRYDDLVDRTNSSTRSYYHATTICLLAISCARPSVSVVPGPHDPAPPIDKDAEIARLTALLEKSEAVHDDSESFMSNFSRKSYQDGERLRKQAEIIHRYTPHDVWRQIGDNVARGEYELSDAEFNGAFMFMDVQGFTSYSEEHGSAEVVKALNIIFAPATETIYECHGDVDKFIGDCIFAVFSDDRNAVQAARRILGLFGTLGEQNPFKVRIGINSGRAVRANVGSPGRREYTYIGDAVNLAQRLEANCTPGRLLVAESIHAPALELFTTVERREITVKGKKLPVRAYECSL